jgi:hypothetical protein
VRSGTAITVEGRSATLEEIHPGVEIRASLSEGELAPIATRIEVGPGLAAPDVPARGEADRGDAASEKAEKPLHENAENAAGEDDAPDQ